MDGILNINKPSGPTSFSVVSRVRRLLNERRAGHGGTLDPIASGVLPVFLGHATRVAEYLMEYPKTYRAGVKLGAETDSFDAEGKVISSCDPSSITRGHIEAVLPRFRGDIIQKPPVYSALKHEGQPLYKLAREGKAVEAEPRPATIYRLDLVSYESPFLTLDLECSKGTYIRSIAHDIGVALGCGAHLSSLVRTAYGPFNINDAVTLETLEQSVNDGTVASLIQPLDAVLTLWDKITLTDEQVEAVRFGVWLPLEGQEGKTRLRSYDGAGRLVALLALDDEKNLWRPHKVYNL
jgi:tRNA pseudouridine55 synthase